MSDNENPSPRPALQRWVFTFGFGHVHPETGESLKNCYVIFYGDANETREEMEGYFGRKWAFQYPSEEAAGVDKYNLRRLVLVT